MADKAMNILHFAFIKIYLGKKDSSIMKINSYKPSKVDTSDSKKTKIFKRST